MNENKFSSSCSAALIAYGETAPPYF
jgi:hypothetical protein